MNLPFEIDLSGKTAVVTGGGGVLCSGFCIALAKCGANVAVLSRRKEKADIVADEIKKAGGTAIGLAANVLDRQDLEAAREIINRELGSCDILINGAGGNDPKANTTKEYLFREDFDPNEGVVSFFDLESKNIGSVFNLNFLGTFIPTQVFARDMADKVGATIINISSMNAFSPLTKIPAYSASKAAVSNFTQWLAVHMSKVGIRVNAIAPGFFMSEQNRDLMLNPDGSLSKRAEKIIGMTPMGRFGNNDDLTGTLLWLVSEKASGFVNGVIIPVDGGFSAYSGV